MQIGLGFAFPISMRHNKHDDWALSHHRQGPTRDRLDRPVLGTENVADLKFIMTHSAFGFEYASKALLEEGEYGLNADRIRADIERFRQAYFAARVKLKNMDADLLEKFEADLQLQKRMLFSEQKYLH